MRDIAAAGNQRRLVWRDLLLAAGGLRSDGRSGSVEPERKLLALECRHLAVAAGGEEHGAKACRGFGGGQRAHDQTQIDAAATAFAHGDNRAKVFEDACIFSLGRIPEHAQPSKLVAPPTSMPYPTLGLSASSSGGLDGSGMSAAFCCGVAGFCWSAAALLLKRRLLLLRCRDGGFGGMDGGAGWLRLTFD